MPEENVTDDSDWLLLSTVSRVPICPTDASQVCRCALTSASQRGRGKQALKITPFSGICDRSTICALPGDAADHNRRAGYHLRSESALMTVAMLRLTSSTKRSETCRCAGPQNVEARTGAKMPQNQLGMWCSQTHRDLPAAEELGGTIWGTPHRWATKVHAARRPYRLVPRCCLASRHSPSS